MSLLVLGGMLLAQPSAKAQRQTGTQATAEPAGKGGIHGTVADPTGAVIPGATVVVRSTTGAIAGKATSDAGGAYAVHGLAAGKYSVTVAAPGFAAYSVPNIIVAAGQMKSLNPALQIEIAQQKVEVQAENTNVIGTSPDENANSIVIKGTDLNSLSDDPDELQNELSALAGPSAGPNGGEIYIDGFTGGQLPPKSSIREIRVNQNPFSAEYDRLGYGRIEIFTKPGTDKPHGQFQMAGNDSSFNSQNPLLVGKTEPPYYSYFMHGSVGGPINKSASYFVSMFARNEQNEDILLAADPTALSNGIAPGSPVPYLDQAFYNPSFRLDVSPRVDLQLGKANTLTLREEYNRSSSTNDLRNSAYSTPSQAFNMLNQENAIQVSDSLILNDHLVDDIRFQYRRIRDRQNAVSSLPSYSLQQLLTAGGNSTQSAIDHENDYELQNYISGAYGAHSLNFGTRLRAYNDINSTTGGSNGSYIFTHPSDFVGCLDPSGPAATCKPSQYSYTAITNPVAKATLFDGALFYQDDWKVNPRFTFSYGVRWETQNYIHDKNDWAPRVAFAYALGRSHGKQQPRTVVRAGYGWFYNRFTVANGFGPQVPYLMTAIHQNGVNVVNYIQSSQTGPITFNPNQTTVITTTGAGRNAPSIYSVAPNMRAANDMEAAGGVDRQLTKAMTGNVTYIFSQGIHQFYTDNVSAAGEITPAEVANDTYPTTQPAPPPTNFMQYQSGGFYKEHQVMVTLRANYRTFSFMGTYTYTNAKGDTSGVGTVPSVSSDPGLDYGRTTFDVTNRFMMFGNFMLPWKISASPMLMANSGIPYNVLIGTDLTANNQYNARPTYAASCSETGAVQTQFGCLDTNPFANPGEKIVPYGLGTGPSNFSMNMRLSKVIGIGPKLAEGQFGASGGGFHGGPRGMGGGGFSGNRGGPGRLDQGVSRRYSLTLSAWGTNILNHTNYGAPSGVMLSPNFGTSQTLQGGFFGSRTSGNRSIFLEAMFAF